MTQPVQPAPNVEPEENYVQFPGLHRQPDVVAAVSQQAPAVTDEHVAMVLKALYLVQNGDPLGTVLTDPDTGEVALRVAVGGVHQWRITSPDGSSRIELGTTLPGWDVLRAAPEAQE